MARQPKRVKRNKQNSAKVRTADADIGEIHFRDKLYDAMKEYGTYVVENRAIADIHDGLKPVHRRILWAAYKMGAHSRGATTKVSRIMGEVTGKYHPHGDAAVVDAMTGMAEGAYLNFLHGQGNFGSYSNMQPAAAPRYIEAKLLPMTENLLLDPYYLKCVPMLPNYDGKDIEPAWLPAKLPLILATGSQGIAVGVNTKLPAYTPDSLRKVCIAILQGKRDTRKLSEMLQFATRYGGHVISPAKARLALFEGREAAPTLQWSCDYTIPTEHKMIVTGFHPEWNYDSMYTRIANLPEVQEVANRSQHDKIRLEISVKKNADGEKTMAKLEKMMQGQITYRCNVIERSMDMEPEIPEIKVKFMTTSPYKMILWWLKWRLHLEKLALKVEHDEIKQALVKERLLLLACQSLDVIFSLLKKRGIDKVKELSKQLDITIEDAQTIWQIAVGRLDRLSETDQAAKIKKLRDRAKEVAKDFKQPAKPVLKELQALQL